MPRVPPDNVIAYARAAQAKWGVPTSISLAQWAVESRWGALSSGKNNPFGIKARVNRYGVPIDAFTPVDTHEVIGGKTVFLREAPFRDFASQEEAFDYHAKLLATAACYAPAQACRADPGAYADRLEGVYATDPQYAEKLRALIYGANNLRRYDA